MGGGPPHPGLYLRTGHPAHRGPRQALRLPSGDAHPTPPGLSAAGQQPANGNDHRESLVYIII